MENRIISSRVGVQVTMLTLLLFAVFIGIFSSSTCEAFPVVTTSATQGRPHSTGTTRNGSPTFDPSRRQVNGPANQQYGRILGERTATLSGLQQLNLVSILKFREELGFLSSADGDDSSSSSRCSSINENGEFCSESGEVYQICLAEEDDLPAVARFVVMAFGAEAIQLSRDMNSFEQMLVQPAVSFMNGYSFVATVVEVLAGLRQRLKYRTETNTMDLSAPNLQGLKSREEQTAMASKSCLVIVLAKPNPESTWMVDIIASVELKLEISDAKIPFSLSWLDRAERFLGSLVGVAPTNEKKKPGRGELQPYLSSLCVDQAYRGKGLGRALVQCVESIASDSWGYSNLYLHVDAENKAAFDLYKSEGYEDVGIRWDPFWAGNAAEVGYYVKQLPATNTSSNAGRVKKRARHR